MTTLAERLGFSPGDRVAIVHCDDIGMCHAANVGAFEALANGPATCGSIMVPCPWFREAADGARENPEFDLGVHLTLNAEWPHYRWGPVAGVSSVPSLVDDQGFLPRTTAETVSRAKPGEVEIELRAQVERALEAGVDVTHLDTHMGTCIYPPFVDVYARLGADYRLPVFAVRPDPETLRSLGLEGAAGVFEELALSLEAGGIPLLDCFDANSLHFEPGEGEAHNRARIRGLVPGVNWLLFHAARDGDELRAITPDAHMRDFERTFYGGELGRKVLQEEGIRTLGMRPLRALVRGEH